MKTVEIDLTDEQCDDLIGIALYQGKELETDDDCQAIVQTMVNLAISELAALI